MEEYIVVIPARLKSSRLPGKPLIDILGTSMIKRTYDQCVKAVDRDLVYVATDSEEISSHCQDHGIQVLMTSSAALTGTDRVCEAARMVKARYYINVQGDEPVFNPADLVKIVEAVKSSENIIYNGYASIRTQKDFYSLSIPKVVLKPDGDLLYMSRSPIPGNKEGTFSRGLKQVCLYAFPSEALERFSQSGKTPMEAEEDIEILRFLELGFEVKMIELSSQSISVDVPEDVARVERYLRESQRFSSSKKRKGQKIRQS